MKINIAQIRQMTGDRQAFHFNYPVTCVCGDDCTWVVGKITVDGTVVNTGTHWSVAGNICALGRHSCNRCLD